MKKRYDTAEDVVAELLTYMGISFDDLEIADDGIGISRLNIRSSRDARSLIGPRGEALQALNLIVKKILEPQSEDDEETLNIIVDVDDYQKERLIKIRNITKIIAERVKLFGNELPLPPMSSYERMIAHSSAKTILDVATESRGQGRERYVMIRAADSPNS